MPDTAVLSMSVTKRDDGFYFEWDFDNGHHERGPYPFEVAMRIYKDVHDKGAELGCECLNVGEAGHA